MNINTKSIEAIASNIMQSADSADKGRGDYLKALVIETQGKLAKGATQAEQVTALASVHAQFYEAVLRVAEVFVPKGTKDRGVALHARANFARTAVSALRRFITAGNDVMSLKADTVTKAFLQARAGPKGPPKPRSGRLLRGLVERRGKAILETFEALKAADKEAAVAELRALVAKLAAQLLQIEKPKAGDRSAASPNRGRRSSQAPEALAA